MRARLRRIRAAAAGRRYTDAKPLGMKLLEPLSDAGGFKASTDWMPRGVGGALTIEFRPPMVTRVVTEFPDGSLQILVFMRAARAARAPARLALMFSPRLAGLCRQAREHAASSARRCSCAARAARGCRW